MPTGSLARAARRSGEAPRRSVTAQTLPTFVRRPVVMAIHVMAELGVMPVVPMPAAFGRGAGGAAQGHGKPESRQSQFDGGIHDQVSLSQAPKIRR